MNDGPISSRRGSILQFMTHSIRLKRVALTTFLFFLLFVSCFLVLSLSAENQEPLIVLLATGGGSPAWSPDGKKIAFISTRSGAGDIYIMNADGSNLQQLTRDLSGEVGPVWSPDGTRIAFTRISHVRGSDIYVIVLEVAPTKIAPSRHFKISLVYLAVLVALSVLLITAALVGKRFQQTHNQKLWVKRID